MYCIVNVCKNGQSCANMRVEIKGSRKVIVIVIDMLLLL
jgi:hypothetical protein